MLFIFGEAASAKLKMNERGKQNGFKNRMVRGCWTVRSGTAKSIENRTISKNTNADITNKLM